MTLGDKIKAISPDSVVALKDRYGVFWAGKARYVFGAVTLEAWNKTDIEVMKAE